MDDIQRERLQKRIRIERLYKTKFKKTLLEEETLKISKPMENNKSVKKPLSEHLDFLKKLVRLINRGATGFDLAYEVEKNKEIKSLIYDGILFYNTFLEIGSQRFIDAPNKKTSDFKSFKTIEDTEKYIFMIWLKETINSLEEDIKPKEDYEHYVEERKEQEHLKTKKKFIKKLGFCKNCGEKIRSSEQEYCEKCGVRLLDNV
ncbi:MAG: zinc ribbon domain-containing protein [Promethearchaeota archaeon]